MQLPADFRVFCVDPLTTSLRALFVQELGPEQFSCATDGESPMLARGANALVTRGREIPRALIDNAPKLGIVQVLGRYPDRVDLGAARRAGVVVATMPHGGAMAVADHTMALVLALARKILRGHLGIVGAEYENLGMTPERTSESSFAFNWLGFSDVLEINRKTIGLIGFGEIGREVARRARGFDMEILYYQRRRIAPEWEEKLGVRFMTLDRLVATADIVSLHAPHTEQTERILDARRLGLMKGTALLVNTSRGGLVDETALVGALERGRLAGAALDVFLEEPLPKASSLTALPNVVLTPHIGGGSGGGQRLLIRQVVENVGRFARGERPLNIVE